MRHVERCLGWILLLVGLIFVLTEPHSGRGLLVVPGAILVASARLAIGSQVAGPMDLAEPRAVP